MNVSRRRYMGDDKADYIQDGLVFWLDGIKRGTTNSKKWIDLISGYEFSTIDDAEATWGNNHLITPCQMDCADYVNLAATNSTFEIVFQENTGSLNTRLFLAKNLTVIQSFGFGRYNNNYLLSNASLLKLSLPLTSAPFGSTNYCFSYNGDRLLVVNGVTKTNTGTVDFYSPVNGKAVVAISSNGGKLFTIRQYNRKLTAEEMLFNQKIDNQRFNLGLNF